MKLPISTYKILMDKALNHDVDETWIDWAIEMMEVGYQSTSLYKLAGETKPYNQFELQELTNRIFDDLNLEYSDTEKVFRDYFYYLIKVNINQSEKYLFVLHEICTLLNKKGFFRGEYEPLVFLCRAKQDLIEFDTPTDYRHADRSNIDVHIKKEFQAFIARYEGGK